MLEERQNHPDILAAQVKARISKPGNREDPVTPLALTGSDDGLPLRDDGPKAALILEICVVVGSRTDKAKFSHPIGTP
jgi:hypothetical protein